MNPHYPRVAERAGHRCEYCHAPEAIFNLPFEVEHVIPASRGGAEDESNWALSCRACNLFKSDYLAAVDPESGHETPLFHPRRERWDDHFRLDSAAGAILGLTATGRATVARLQMNNPLQVSARLVWARLGLL
jgi:hypothetical protein